MKQRRIYYRKKGNKIVIEGRTSDNKPILIWTLPSPDAMVTEIASNASFLTQEKKADIYQKYLRLEIKDSEAKKQAQEVRLINIKRSPENDAKIELTEEQKKMLYELTK